MKKPLILTSLLFVLAAVGVHAQGTSSILLTSGSLAIPDGDLVQLVADTSGSFGAPTASSFTGNDPDEVVVDSFAMDDTVTQIKGVLQETVNFNLGTGAGEVPAGTSLMLRWFPTISFSSYNALSSVPGAGTAYGQFTSATQEFPGDTNPQTTTAWTVPANGQYNYDVWFLTVNEDSNGPSTPSNPPANSAGLANYTVAAVPEPGSLSLVAGAIGLGAVALRRRRR